MAQIIFNFTTPVAARITAAVIGNHGGSSDGTPAEQWAYVKVRIKDYLRDEVATYERNLAVQAANAGVDVSGVEEE